MKMGGRKSSNVEDRGGDQFQSGGPATRRREQSQKKAREEALRDYKTVKATPEVGKKMEGALKRIKREAPNPFEGKVKGWFDRDDY